MTVIQSEHEARSDLCPDLCKHVCQLGPLWDTKPTHGCGKAENNRDDTNVYFATSVHLTALGKVGQLHQSMVVQQTFNSS